MPASAITASPPNRVKPRDGINSQTSNTISLQVEPHQPQQLQNHTDRNHSHQRSQYHQQLHNNHSQHRSNHQNHNNNYHHQVPQHPQHNHHSMQNGLSFNSKDNGISNGGSGGGGRNIMKELDTVSDKLNQNTWFITNEQRSYYDSSGSIPIIPLFTHTANSVDFHKNGSASNANNGANINYSNGKEIHLNGNGTTHHLNRRNDFIGDEEDLLTMGRIQELRDRMGNERVKMNEKALWKCLGAEFLGSALLMFFGIGCVLKLQEEEVKGLNFTGVAVCWGFTVATLVQSLGGVSCDINPAVTMASLVTGKIPIVKAIMYILIQCLGCLAGTSLLKAVTPDSVEGNWGITQLAPGITPIQGCIIEIVSTFVLVFTAFSVNDENRRDIKGSTPLAMGICVCAIVMCSGPLTGASLNPARSLGPSIIAGHFDNHWIYWLGPIVGGMSAALIYQNIFRQLRPDEVEALEAENQLRRQEREAKENGTAPPV